MVTSLDVFIRQQIYVEQYKNYQEEQSSYILEEIIALIILLMMKKGYDNLGDMPKAELLSMLSELNKRLTIKFGKFEKVTINQLKSFFNASHSLTGDLFKVLSGKHIKVSGANKLWAKMMASPMPGVGDEPSAVFRSFTKSIYTNVVKVIKQGYADKLSVVDTLKLITGTRKNNFKDGLINKLHNQFNTTIRTFIQNVSSFINYSLGSLFFEQYQWVSVLDSHTTEICRARDGNVYFYGKGPRPPAHYNCRSTIIPVAASDNVKDMPTFFAWAKAQPAHVQNEVFGKRAASALRSGEMTADHVGRFTTDKKLTLEEFKGKRNSILTVNDRTT